MFQPVSKETVRRYLTQLRSTKSPGHDNIPLRLIRDGADIIANPLIHIITLSLKLKIARAIPLYKSEDKALPDNYCPISVLPVLSKIS